MPNHPFAIEPSRSIKIAIAGYDAQAAVRLQRNRTQERSRRLNRQDRRKEAVALSKAVTAANSADAGPSSDLYDAPRGRANPL